MRPQAKDGRSEIEFGEHASSRGPCLINGLCNACKMRRGRTACFWWEWCPQSAWRPALWTLSRKQSRVAVEAAVALSRACHCKLYSLLQSSRRRRSTLASYFNSLIGQARRCSWCGPRPCFRDAILHLAVTPASLDHCAHFPARLPTSTALSCSPKACARAAREIPRCCASQLLQWCRVAEHKHRLSHPNRHSFHAAAPRIRPVPVSTSSSPRAAQPQRSSPGLRTRRSQRPRSRSLHHPEPVSCAPESRATAHLAHHAPPGDAPIHSILCSLLLAAAVDHLHAHYPGHSHCDLSQHQLWGAGLLSQWRELQGAHDRL
jgi:hypothetical protein